MIGFRPSPVSSTYRRIAGSLILAFAVLAAAPQAARAQSEPFLGQIVAFPYTFCPNNWLEADGRLVPASLYSALYALIGNTYGGDATSFALPDLRGRAAVGVGQGPGLSNVARGQKRGATEATVGVVNAGSGTTVLGQRRVGTLLGVTVPISPPSLVLRYCIAVNGITPQNPGT